MVDYAGVERERLLEAEQQLRAEKPLNYEQGNVEATWRNLPQKKQLLLLALCRLSTPLSNACLLPYIYYLVKSILSDPDHPSAPQQISRLTGLLVATYPLGQMSTSMIWGRLSDSYGRKPIIILGLSVSVVANLAFGFSRSVGTLLFWRVCAGMANGTLGVMRTMTAEIVKERKHHTRAFLALPLVFNSGRVVALVIGGCLANPVDNLAWLFGPSGVFNFYKNAEGVSWAVEYPFALPALFNGTVLATCLVLATLWLKESLPSREGNWDPGLALGNAIFRYITRRSAHKKHNEYTRIHAEEGESMGASMPATGPGTGVSTARRAITESNRSRLHQIWTLPLVKALLAFGLVPLHNATFLHIFPVFLSIPAAGNEDATFLHFTGGLGLASPAVGLYLATFGICGILLQLFIYPRIQKHIGNLGMFRLANSIFPAAYVVAPYLSLLSSHKRTKWIAMAAVLFLQVLARTMAMPSSVVLLTEAAPRRSVLGTVHGAGSTLSALSSAAGPIIGGMILSRSIDVGVVGLVWWCWLSIVALVALAWSFVLRKSESDEEVKSEAQFE